MQLIRSIVDIETTGLNPKNDEIIQICVLQVDENYQIKDVINRYYLPREKEPYYFTIDFLKEKTKNNKYKHFKDDVEMHNILKEITYLIAHNVDFEYRFLKDYINISPENMFCTMKNYTNICKLPSKKYSFKQPKLEEALQFIDNLEEKLYNAINNLPIKIDKDELNYHNAIYDVIGCYLLYKYYGEKVEYNNNIQNQLKLKDVEMLPIVNKTKEEITTTESEKINTGKKVENKVIDDDNIFTPHQLYTILEKEVQPFKEFTIKVKGKLGNSGYSINLFTLSDGSLYKLDVVVPQDKINYFASFIGQNIVIKGTPKVAFKKNAIVSVQIIADEIVGSDNAETNNLLDGTQQNLLSVFDLKRQRKTYDIKRIIFDIFSNNKKPNIHILIGQSAIIDEDISRSCGGYCDKYNLNFVRSSFGNTESIIKGIETIIEEEPDIIVISRGGGSGLEVFNNATLLEYVLQIDKPIISAVGHAEDITLFELFADERFITPTEFGKFLKEIYLEYEKQTEHKKTKEENDKLREELYKLKGDLSLKGKLEEHLEFQEREKQRLIEEINRKNSEIENLKKIVTPEIIEKISNFNVIENSLKEKDNTLKQKDEIIENLKSTIEKGNKTLETLQKEFESMRESYNRTSLINKVLIALIIILVLWKLL